MEYKEDRDDQEQNERPDNRYELTDDMQAGEEELADLIAAEVENAAGSEEVQAELANLKAQLEAQKQETEKEHNHYLRAIADFNNYRRRHQDEYAKHLELANQDFLVKLLPVIDNFERAARAAEDIHDFDALARGVDLTLKNLHDILEREGVIPIEAVGQEFDPNLHEAVMRMETDEYPENTVVEEFEKGYIHKGHVIRPSRVKVSVNE